MRPHRHSPLSSWRPHGHLSPPASPAVLVHDWIWRRREPGTVISLALLKRLNLIVGQVGNLRTDCQSVQASQARPNTSTALLLVLLLAKLIMICPRRAFYPLVPVGLHLAGRLRSPRLRRLRIRAALANRPAVLLGASPLHRHQHPRGTRSLHAPHRPMLRAARGPLADSILLYVTAANIAIVLSVLAAAALLPRLLRPLPRSGSPPSSRSRSWDPRQAAALTHAAWTVTRSPP